MFFGNKIKKEVNQRSKTNPLWSYDLLKQTVSKTLDAYVDAINSGSSDYLSALTTTQHLSYINAMLAYMKANGLSVKSKRQITKFKIKEISGPEVVDGWFVAELGVGYQDKLYEYGKEFDKYADSVADNLEEWHFKLDNNRWQLNLRNMVPIFQSRAITDTLTEFANKNDYVASGLTENWFATRGSWLTPLGNADILFSGASAFNQLNTSVLYQVAELSRQESDDFEGTYLIGHIKLEKSYEKIVVIPRAQIKHGKKINPKDRIELEWPQFNERFLFFAPATARISALELVNPKFMQELYDMNSLAIVDIVADRALVFIKLDNETLTEQDVLQMQQILRIAQKELAL